MVVFFVWITTCSALTVMAENVSNDKNKYFFIKETVINFSLFKAQSYEKNLVISKKKCYFASRSIRMVKKIHDELA